MYSKAIHRHIYRWHCRLVNSSIKWARAGEKYWAHQMPGDTYALSITCKTYSNRIIISLYNGRRLNKLENLFQVCCWLTLWHEQTIITLWFSCLICSKEEKCVLKALWNSSRRGFISTKHYCCCCYYYCCYCYYYY